MVIFNRVKSASAIELDPETLLITAGFIDTFHEINLELKIKHKEMVVMSAKADMVRTPHPDCPQAGIQAENLVGIKIGPGSRNAIFKAVGHAEGCTHLADLTLDAFKAAIQAKFKISKRELSPEERLAKFSEQLGGTCYHWTRAVK